jgi:CheY-like chemotaxis protein
MISAARREPFTGHGAWYSNWSHQPSNPDQFRLTIEVKNLGTVIKERRIRVLVVEDDFLLRLDAVQTIEEAGFDVLEAANADEAISILEVRSDINVIFADINMPGSMDGLKLAHAVRGRWPPIKIITTSGHVRVKNEDLPAGGRFISKPYSLGYVTGVIRELVDD